MAEKQTDYLAMMYFENVYNRIYNTENNKTLFNTLVPDGWLYDEDNHNLLIIENKQCITQEKAAMQQLQKYITVAKQHSDINDIYCMFCSGTTQEEFTVKYYNECLQPINEQSVVRLFKQQSMNKPIISPQQIHNMLVKNFHYDKPNELYDILLIIMLSFTDERLTQYYNITNHDEFDKIDKQFVNILCQNAVDILGKQYEKYTDAIKHTEFTNVFNTCKTIYEAYNDNYNIVGSLLDQFKKYKQDYTTNKNEVWTDKDIAMLMFNEVKPFCNYLVNKFGYINVFDPCVGGGNLLKPFINEYNNRVNLYGCDILKHYTMLNKLEILINNIQGEFYNGDFMTIDGNVLPRNVITICNPPYSKSISKYESIGFLAKSSQHSLLCCYIFPLSQLRKPACKQYRDTIVSNHDVIKVLKMGSKLFYTSIGFVGTGDIAIVITMKKSNICKPLKVYDLSSYGNERKKIPHGGVIISKQGLKQLDDYNHGLLKPELRTINTDSLTWVDNDGLIMDEDSLRNHYKNVCIKLLKQRINDYITNGEHVIVNIGEELDKIDNDVNNMIFKQVKLTELFTFVSKRNGVSKDVPKYGATQTNNPVDYCDVYNYCIPNDDLNRYVWFVSTGDGAAGYCHRLRHRCVYLQSSFLTKSTMFITDENIMLISLQLHQVFNHSNTLSKQRFNNTSVYITSL